MYFRPIHCMHLYAHTHTRLDKNWIIWVIRWELNPLKNYVGVLGLAPCHVSRKWKNSAGTSGWSVPISSQLMSSFVGSGLMSGPLPPARYIKRDVVEFLHLFRCHTHTHTRPKPGKPWKARERKKRTHTMGKRTKQRRGGRNGPPEPTYTEKRTQPTQSTPRNPTTHYRGARGTKGKLGTNGITKLIGIQSQNARLCVIPSKVR